MRFERESDRAMARERRRKIKEAEAMTLEDVKDTIPLRNATSHLWHRTKGCKTWKQVAIMLFMEFSKD